MPDRGTAAPDRPGDRAGDGSHDRSDDGSDDGSGDRSGFRPWREAWTRALYGEHGFYRRAEGPRGHFETSANAAGGVVEVLAEALLELAARHGCRQLVDLGAGRGELLSALAATGAGAPGPDRGGATGRGRSGTRPAGRADGLALTGLDVVPRPAGLPDAVAWVTAPGGSRLPAELRGLDRVLVLAHEWLDVVPCDVLEVDADGAVRVVEVDRAGSERLGATASPEQLEWCARWWPVAALEPGARVEVGLTRDAAWADLVSRVRSGVLVAVDYGHERGDRPPLGSLAAHRAGRLVPPVPDGSCDLTAEVAWDAVLAAGAATMQQRVTSDSPLHQSPAGAGSARLTTQRAALLDLGVGGRGGRGAGGGLGPVPGHQAPAAYLRDLQRSSAAATLLDPGGLGGLGWLVQEVATGQADPRPARVEP